MSTILKLKTFFTIPSIEPDDLRRRKLLNILMVPVSVGILLVIIASLLSPEPDTGLLLASIIALLGLVSLYLVNIRLSGRIAAILFLVFMLTVFTFSDTPQELTAGRSLFAFAIPIVLASGLIHPIASFVVAVMTGGIMVLLAQLAGMPTNTVAIIGFFLVAFISWMISRDLERALRDVREINANLDRLVQERTRELAESLARERVEAGRSRAILDGIADGVIVFDMHGTASEANPSICFLLDLPQEALLGATLQDLTRVKTLDPRNRDILAGLLAQETPSSAGVRIQLDSRTLSVTAAQVRGPLGEHIGVVAVFRDFTREAEIEKMKNSFLAIVSHELRTPLNAIMGYAEMLKESIYGPVNEKQGRASERIMTNAHRLLEIVSDLLDQAQIEAGKLTIQMAPFSPLELLENLHGVMDKPASDKGLAFTSQAARDLPEVIFGDAARLHQVLVNLVNNGIKFTDTGSVKARLFRVDETHWGMEVADSGAGIPEKELPLIFDAFHQADDTITRRHGGFGLGLSIVKQLVHLMGGQVNVRSDPGSGSIFTVTLPLVTDVKG